MNACCNALKSSFFFENFHGYQYCGKPGSSNILILKLSVAAALGKCVISEGQRSVIC